MIRAKDIIESVEIVMNERNVINVPHLEKYIDELSRNTNVPEVKQWLQKTLRLYLINDFPDVLPFDTEVEPDSPYYQPWVADALRRGEKIYLVTPDIHATQVFNHVIDYLNAAMGAPDYLPEELRIKRLNALSYEDVWEKVLGWDEWLHSSGRSRGSSEGGTEEVMSVGGGYKWVKVLTRDALDYEGSEMGHCVGSYAHHVEQNHCQIYSLRDSRNEPHVTIEARGEYVHQIKGKQNKEVVEKYWGYCREFLNSGIFTVAFIQELDNIHADTFRGKVYDINDMPDDWWKGIGWERTWQKFPYGITNMKVFMEQVKMALNRGADPNLRIVKGHFGDISTAFMMVCMSQNQHAKTMRDLLDLLLRHGCDVNAGDDRGETALHKVVKNGDSYLMNYLLEKGADPNAASKTGITPLDILSKDGRYLSMLPELLRAGAKVRKFSRTQERLIQSVHSFFPNPLRNELLGYLRN